MGLLEGKVAVVTGAGGGIGREHALCLAREGAKVIVNDLGGSRDGTGSGSEMADRVVQEIRDAGGEAIANADSVATPQGAQNIIKSALDTYGQIDILINNAGILRDRTIRKMSVEEFDIVIQVHLRGTFLCLQAAANAMIEAGRGGKILNTSSTSGLLGNFGQGNYGAAKAGIFGLSRVAHLEFAKYKINVNVLVPVAYTRMTDDLPGMQSEGLADALAPKLVADVALFMVSDLADDISGEVIGVRGNNVFYMKMARNEPLKPRDGKHWTVQELKERWREIKGNP